MNHVRLVLLLLVLGILALTPHASAAPAASPCVAGIVYNSACDVDHDGDVDILDVQLTAGHWNQNGTYTGDAWPFTGPAGTTPGGNFAGRTRNQAM